MRKNGFTLIELLAVIVILAIIALIATPIILGIINDAKEEANKRSVDNYAKAVQNAVVRNQLVENNNINGCFTTEDGTNLTLLDKTESSLIVEYEGSNIKCNTIEIYKDGNVYLDECIVNRSDKKYSYGKKQGYNGIYEGDASRKTTDNQNGCLKFYAFNDSCGDTINLLLDHNTTATTTWNNWHGTISGPKEVLNELYNDTKNWNGVNEVKNSAPKQSVVEYIINYEEQGYKARLIQADEIAKITGKDEWQESYYFFHDLSQNSNTGSGSVCKETGCEFKWLYDRTNMNCKDSGCENNSDVNLTGYWTATIASGNGLFMVWNVRFDGSLKASYVIDGTGSGVRPVIEVSKSKLQIN